MSKPIAYTYELYNLSNGMRYYGSRYAESVIDPWSDTKYMSSSASIKEAIKNGDKFVKSILMTFDSAKDALAHEAELQKRVDAKNNPNFYNKANTAVDGFYINGELAKLYGKIGGPIGAERCHALRTEDGKSVNGVKNANRLHLKKNAEGKSIHGIKAAGKLSAVKNADGKSAIAVRNATNKHALKNSEGKSIAGLEAATRINAEKTEDGKSINASKGGKIAGKLVGAQRWKCLCCDKVSNAGALGFHQKSTGHTGKVKIS